MKNIEVTYDVLMLYGIREQGEAAFILQVEDALAAEYLTGKADYCAVNLVETALARLCGAASMYAAVSRTFERQSEEVIP